MNLQKLDQELKTVCPRVVGCSSTGRIDFADGTSWKLGDPKLNADHTIVETVLKAHDPSETQDQKFNKDGMTKLMAALIEIASKGRTNAPAWAKNVVDEAATKIDNL